MDFPPDWIRRLIQFDGHLYAGLIYFSRLYYQIAGIIRGVAAFLLLYRPAIFAQYIVLLKMRHTVHSVFPLQIQLFLLRALHLVFQRQPFDSKSGDFRHEIEKAGNNRF